MLAWIAPFRRLRRAGVRVSHEQLVGMFLRRVRLAEVLQAVAIAAEAGVEFPVDHAEIASLAGGRPIEQARAAVIIAGRGEPVELMAISACDLCNYDVVRLARDGWDLSKVVGAADGPGEGYRRSPA
jgi:uncharacterized protein YqfA (UPF0365 family)